MIKEAFTTAGPYTRAYGHDRRIRRGDDFAGDAWREPGGVIFWVAPGVQPDGERRFDVCPDCAGEGQRLRGLGEDDLWNELCPRCEGQGWVQAATNAQNNCAELDSDAYLL